MVQVLLSSFIVVSPQYPFVPNDDDRRAERRSWHWVNKANIIDQIISIVIAEFGGDPNRIFVTGFSRGGLGALEITPNLRNRIAKLVAADSERIPGNLPDIPIWIHYGGAPTFKNIYEAHQPLIDQIGEGLWEDAPPDAPVPVSRRPVTTWNQNHTNTCIAAYSDSRIYEWLLR